MYADKELIAQCIIAALPVLIEKYDPDWGSSDDVAERYQLIAHRAVLAAASVVEKVNKAMEM